jgi:hypothetical protein
MPQANALVLSHSTKRTADHGDPHAQYLLGAMPYFGLD